MKWTKTKQGAWYWNGYRIVKEGNRFQLFRIGSMHAILKTYIGGFNKLYRAKRIA